MPSETKQSSCFKEDKTFGAPKVWLTVTELVCRPDRDMAVEAVCRIDPGPESHPLEGGLSMSHLQHSHDQAQLKHAI